MLRELNDEEMIMVSGGTDTCGNPLPPVLDVNAIPSGGVLFDNGATWSEHLDAYSAAAQSGNLGSYYQWAGDPMGIYNDPLYLADVNNLNNPDWAGFWTDLAIIATAGVGGAGMVGVRSIGAFLVGMGAATASDLQ